ncbi:phospholipase D-like domain-containing protein [Rhizobium beringeri]
MVRAAAISAQFGDLRPELLSAGHAIIHDKIVVIDPLHPDNCTVITGSHNLGYKASYQNDENLLIVRGNQSLAVAYAIHILDVYDHYVLRAKLQEELRQSLIATGRAPKTGIGWLPQRQGKLARAMVCPRQGSVEPGLLPRPLIATQALRPSIGSCLRISEGIITATLKIYQSIDLFWCQCYKLP